HADLAHARRHAPGLHRLPARQRILALHPRIARYALLAHPRRAPVHRLLIGTLLHALLIAPAPVLVDQHDPILRALVDRLARTGRQTPRIRAVIADPLQVEEERLVLRQTGPLALPRLRRREPRLVVAIHQAAHTRRRVLVDVHEAPFLVRRDVADRRLPDLGPRIEDRKAFEHAVWRMVLAPHAGVPHLSARVHLLHQLRH